MSIFLKDILIHNQYTMNAIIYFNICFYVPRKQKTQFLQDHKHITTGVNGLILSLMHQISMTVF